MSNSKDSDSVKATVLTIEEVSEVDEVTPLLNGQVTAKTTKGYQDCCDTEATAGQEEVKTSRSVAAILSLLLIGVFISQADTSLVLATYGQISSEFNNLESGSWLLTSYMLAMCVTQPMYGKFSDIFGRKAIFQVAYILFAAGTLICGLGLTLGQIIIGRVIQGAGGAGMVCMVSILITDLVPLRDVASYRSYVNIVQTVGRSAGGAIGGYLATTVGWRWAFLGQFPITLAAILLVWWKLKEVKKDDKQAESHLAKLKRIDYFGVLFMSPAVVCFLLALDMGGVKIPWSHPFITILFVSSVLSGALFLIVEKYWAKEPVFPLHLITHYDVFTSYTILLMQYASQTALMFLIPMYFQVTKNASPAIAGAYLIPAIVGNTTGGLITGAYIKRYGRYKFPIIVSSVSAILSFTLLIAFWKGNSGPWQSLFVFPAGLATGIAASAVFVALSNGVAEDEIAIAGSGLYLSGNVGGVTGLSGASALFQAALRSSLTKNLQGVDNWREIIHKALSDVNFVQGLEGPVHRLIVKSYVSSFQISFVLPLVCSVIALLVGLASREKRLAAK